MSCRTTYQPQFIREDVLKDRMSGVEHEGFAPRLFEAIAAFCDYYGIETLNTPPLNPEFENPLFLKTLLSGAQQPRVETTSDGASWATANLLLPDRFGEREAPPSLGARLPSGRFGSATRRR